jgi:acyl-CoA synthetase (AMP-forming)/AMP-acid ligase II
MGGVNTLLSILCNGGTAVTVGERSTETVCRAVQDHRVDLLPATPTFLNMLLISEAHRRFDLTSIEFISYGTEPMPAATLTALREVFPGVKFRQLYGLTELGILPTRTHADDALKVRLGGEGCEVKVVDGILRIRTETAMLGYLNAPSPFDEEGWFNTGDAVVQEGDYLRVLGRESELINVGGEKVFPAEVENAILQVENVRDAVVWGKSNPITGSIVAARVRLRQPEPAADVERRIRAHCRAHLAHFKIPAVVEVVEEELHGERFKRIRKPEFLANQEVKTT